MMNVRVPRLGAIVMIVMAAAVVSVLSPARPVRADDGGAVAAGGPHLFHYAPPAGSPTVSVSVAGDFNGWSSTANPMLRANDGTYTTTVTLPAGVQHYKIVYDGKWIADPEADKAFEVNNGFGDVLSGVNIPAQGATAQAFRYAPPAGSPTVPVSIAGDFNGWSAAPNPMVRGADGAYTTTIQIAPGLHHYKVVYDGKWIPDPAADPSLENDDGFGGKNSGVNVVPGKGVSMHTFRYAPPAGSPTVAVSVAGDFNQWSGIVNPLTRGTDGVYSAAIAVPPGLHHYKIVYDGKWIPDPAADHSLDADDGFGGKNSGIQVPDAATP